jgi:hypothetical protein
VKIAEGTRDGRGGGMNTGQQKGITDRYIPAFQVNLIYISCKKFIINSEFKINVTSWTGLSHDITLKAVFEFRICFRKLFFTVKPKFSGL